MTLLQVTISGGDADRRTVVLSVRDDVDMASQPEFQAGLTLGIRRAAEKASRCLVVDLTDVPFFASAGAAALVNAKSEAEAMGVELRVVAITVVRRVLYLTQLDMMLDM